MSVFEAEGLVWDFAAGQAPGGFASPLPQCSRENRPSLAHKLTIMIPGITSIVRLPFGAL